MAAHFLFDTAAGEDVSHIVATNSMRGIGSNGGYVMVFANDAVRDQLVVGQPTSNVVSLFRNQTSPSFTLGGYISGNRFNTQQGGSG